MQQVYPILFYQTFKFLPYSRKIPDLYLDQLLTTNQVNKETIKRYFRLVIRLSVSLL